MSQILIDTNNLVIRYLFNGACVINKEVQWQLWEFQVFNAILDHINKFKAKEIVLGVDKGSWRKLIYPLYKGNRAKNKEESDIDWDMFYVYYSNLMEDFKKVLPFKVLSIKNCEADDIIAVIAKHTPEKSIVISSDEDFTQLINSKTKVWHPLKKVFRQCDNIDEWLEVRYLNGQKKDYIFNILTPIDKEPEKAIRFGESKALKIVKEGTEKWIKQNNLEDRYKLNKKIINLSEIPQTLTNKIIQEYNDYTLPNPDGMYNYFESKGWTHTLENFSYVENTLLKLYM